MLTLYIDETNQSSAFNITIFIYFKLDKESRFVYICVGTCGNDGRTYKINFIILQNSL